MKTPEIKKYLESLSNYEVQLHKKKYADFSLDNIRGLLARIGNPQDRLKIIHVAGSKGKGSVCEMTATILRQAGYRVGLYTSPHLQNIRERIRILEPEKIASKDEQKYENTETLLEGQISENSFVLSAGEIIAQAKNIPGFTFFEFITAVAFHHFSKEKVDFTVLECGLGGRLDATNVAHSLVAAVTSLSLEHVHILGGTLARIAAEKIAIVKDEGQNVVIAPQQEEALMVIRQHCGRMNAAVCEIGKDIFYEKKEQSLSRQFFTLEDHRDNEKKRTRYEDLILKMAGDHQIWNAAVTYGIIASLRKKGVAISDEALYKGLKSAHLPCRFEVISENPLVILDGAHNIQAVKCLLKTVKQVSPAKKITMILGMSSDKDFAQILKFVHPSVEEIILTSSVHPRARYFQTSDFKDFPGQNKYHLTKDVKEALALAQNFSQENYGIIVTGSLFVAAEARNILLAEKDLSSNGNY